MVHNIDTNKTALTYLNSLTYYFILGTMGTLVAYFTNIEWNEIMATLDNWGGKKKIGGKNWKKKNSKKKKNQKNLHVLLY